MLPAAAPAPVADKPVLAGATAGAVAPASGVAGHGEVTGGDDEAGPAATVEGAATVGGAATDTDPDPLEAPLADELAQDGSPVARAAGGVGVVDAGGVVGDTAGMVDDTDAVTVVGVALAGETVAVTVGDGLGGGVLVGGVAVGVVDALGATGVATGGVDGTAAGCDTTFVAGVASASAVADPAVHIRTRNTSMAARSTASRSLVRPTAVARAPVRMRYGTPPLPEAHGPGHGATLPGRIHGREPHNERGGGPASQPA